MSITSLPEEIFAKIVELLLPTYNDQRAPRLNILRLVCRRWDESIQQTPSLWTYIWNGTNNIYTEQALRRSGTLGLRVRVSIWEKVQNRDRERFWSALLPHVGRWEHADLSGTIGRDIPQALAFKAAPRLRSLTLSPLRWQAYNGPFLWPLPNLDSLRIQNFGVPWSPQQHPSARLKHLYINLKTNVLATLHIPSSAPLLALRQIFDALRECPELVRLHLDGIPYPWNGLQEKPTPISLPHLEVISFGSVATSIKCQLLETIHVPKCRLIVICKPYERTMDGQVLAALENLASCIGTTKIPNRAIVEFQDSDHGPCLNCDLRAADGGCSFMRLRLQVSRDSPYNTHLEEVGPFFHRWVGSFGPNTGWDVRVTSWSAISVRVLLSAFATYFPMALKLTITKPAEEWSPNSLRALYDPSGEPAFPYLEDLELWYCKPFAREILPLISRRVIRKDTLDNGVTPLCMRIKVPKDIDEAERVELAWLENQIPNLTIQET
ncbi:hypothetical protein FRC01_002772 [Tulasnella sp. 417]|nr:hypothetical protein FRC01_002772 [Tulasnella sp. 417]